MNEQEVLSLDKLLNGHGTQDLTVKLPSSNSGKKQETLRTKTLESLHVQNIDKLRKEKENVKELQAELAKKKAEFKEIDSQFDIPFQLNNNKLLYERSKLEKEIQELTEKINMLGSGESEADYFLRVGEILFSYSDAQNQIATGQKVKDKVPLKKRVPANSVYSYFSEATSVEPTENTCFEAETEIEENTIEHITKTEKKASILDTNIGFQRDKALECYMNALNPNNLHTDSTLMSTIEENYGNCPVCDSEMLFNETFLDCPDCGYRDYILVDSEKPSYKDPPREMSYYAYKKINHFNEWLAQFQAKETTDIPPAVLEQIRVELRKERITDMKKLKASKLKEVLKKLKLSRCYDHVAHILNRLNGISAPVLSREVEEKLRFMFKEIQFSFVKHCPKKRSNFLSYSYVLYKFCELLELDAYLPCFPLLKSREKLFMQDKIWQLICADMRWQFIRTV
jgi:hypothetical protein